MFGGLGNLAKMAAQAGQMKSKMEEMQKRLPMLRMTGEVGGVTIEVSGAMEVVRCQIADGLLQSSSRTQIENLIRDASNIALSKAREASAAEMSAVMGGMDMPGIGDALKGLGLG